jgi:hypothetical protein
MFEKFNERLVTVGVISISHVPAHYNRVERTPFGH